MGLTFSSSEDKLNKMYEIDKNALEYIINWLKNTKEALRKATDG